MSHTKKEYLKLQGILTHTLARASAAEAEVRKLKHDLETAKLHTLGLEMLLAAKMAVDKLTAEKSTTCEMHL